MNTQQYFYSLRSGKDRERDSLYTRAGNAVFRGGYQTMNELCAATEADLWRIRAIGAKCVKLILEERQTYLKAQENESLI